MRSPHLHHVGVEADTDEWSLRNVTGWNCDPGQRQVTTSPPASDPRRASSARRSACQHGPGGAGHCDEPFVEVRWDEALDLLAVELQGVYATHGSSGRG